jgi:sugar phosphate permease
MASAKNPSRVTNAADTLQANGRWRWIIIGIAFLAIVINYVDRANLSVALPYLEDDLNLDPALSGLILGAFSGLTRYFKYHLVGS